MDKLKILLITAQVINQRNYERFSLNLLHEKYDLTVLDISYMFSEELFNKTFQDRKENLNYIIAKNINNFRNLSYHFNRNDLLISLIGSEDEISSEIYSVIKPYQEKICIVCISAFPKSALKLKFFLLRRIIAKLYREKSIIGILKKIIYITSRKFLNKKKNIVPGYLLVCGSEVAKESGFDNSKAKIIKSCSYDFILSKAKYTNLIKEKYIVFLDEYLINHTDFLILKAGVEDEKLYYKELNNFFKYIEDKFKLIVVVAAHPRSDINYTKKMLPNYKVLIGQTPCLVKFSEGCIVHASTSINFAVIYKKPILFLSSARMSRTRIENYQLASWFNKKPINMSKRLNYLDIENALKIEEKYYPNYIRKFVAYEKDSQFGFSQLISDFEST